MPDQTSESTERICSVLCQNGYHEVRRNIKFVVMGKDDANGRPDIQTTTILVPNRPVITSDIYDIICRKSGLTLDQFK